MVSQPLNPVTLYARSFAEEAWLISLADVHELLKSVSQARIIGGTMVTLHVHRWHLTGHMERLTLDSDLGVERTVIVEGNFSQGLARLGYTETGGGHYERTISLPTDDSQNPPIAVVDLLVPAYTSRARRSIRVGDIFTTEVLGLAEAFHEAGIRVAAVLKGRSGWTANIVLTVPSEPVALLLKAMAWKERMADKDAFDMWRMLEVCFAAGIKPGPKISFAVESVLPQAFARENGPAMVGLLRIFRANATMRRQLWTRIRALIQNVVGS